MAKASRVSRKIMAKLAAIEERLEAIEKALAPKAAKKPKGEK